MTDESIEIIRKASTGWRLMKLTTVFNNVMKDELEAINLTKDQFSILMTLLENDGIKQKQISERAQLPEYSVTRGLNALDKEGFTIRDKSEESRRCFAIRLTEKGHKIQPTFINIIEKVNSKLLKDLTKEESQVFDAVLLKLTK